LQHKVGGSNHLGSAISLANRGSLSLLAPLISRALPYPLPSSNVEVLAAAHDINQEGGHNGHYSTYSRRRGELCPAESDALK
jgi:hypothetical protein